jgi:hypothetical protein
MVLIRITCAVLYLAALIWVHAWCMDTGRYLVTLVMHGAIFSTIALMGILKLS